MQIIDEDGNVFDFDPSYNAAPGMYIPLLFAENGKFKIMRGKWGFMPRWATPANMKAKPINARSETVGSNRLFKGAFKHGRALTQTDGFFEWKAIPGSTKKQPYWIRRKDRRGTLIAAICDFIPDPSTNAATPYFALLTTQPNDLVGTIHDRMPVFLEPEQVAEWLAPDAPLDHLENLFHPSDSRLYEAVPIGSSIGNVKNQGADLLQPTGAPIPG